MCGVRDEVKNGHGQHQTGHEAAGNLQAQVGQAHDKRNSAEQSARTVPGMAEPLSITWLRPPAG
jgi:hypothetical protein